MFCSCAASTSVWGSVLQAASPNNTVIKVSFKIFIIKILIVIINLKYNICQNKDMVVDLQQYQNTVPHDYPRPDRHLSQPDLPHCFLTRNKRYRFEVPGYRSGCETTDRP